MTLSQKLDKLADAVAYLEDSSAIFAQLGMTEAVHQVHAARLLTRSKMEAIRRELSQTCDRRAATWAKKKESE